MTGASINICSGERLTKKSHTSFKPSSDATVKSSPEKKLTLRSRIFRTSTRIGLIINSELAFSEPVAVASGSPSLSAYLR